eukprot:1143792-Pelagomonas_calceolata.AAC.8
MSSSKENQQLDLHRDILHGLITPRLGTYLVCTGPHGSGKSFLLNQLLSVPCGELQAEVPLFPILPSAQNQ